MAHPLPHPKAAFARLRDTVARAVRRVLGLDRMAALVAARIAALIAELEATLDAWKRGEFTPAPSPARMPPALRPSAGPASSRPSAVPPRTGWALPRWLRLGGFCGALFHIQPAPAPRRTRRGGPVAASGPSRPHDTSAPPNPRQPASPKRIPARPRAPTRQVARPFEPKRPPCVLPAPQTPVARPARRPAFKSGAISRSRRLPYLLR